MLLACIRSTYCAPYYWRYPVLPYMTCAFCVLMCTTWYLEYFSLVIRYRYIIASYSDNWYLQLWPTVKYMYIAMVWMWCDVKCILLQIYPNNYVRTEIKWQEIARFTSYSQLYKALRSQYWQCGTYGRALIGWIVCGPSPRHTYVC